MSDDPMSSALLYIEELESRCEHLETDRNNLALARDVLIKERDEVRALYCQKLSPVDPQKVAEKWRWDCFDNGKNSWLLPKSKCKECMDKLAELDEELGLNE